MKNLIAVLTVLIITSASGVSAAPATKASVEKMFDIMGVSVQMKGGFESMMPVIDQQAAQLQLSSAETEQLRNIYREWFEVDLDHEVITRNFVDLYASRFTEEEVQELIEFYQSPVGQKYLKLAPQLMKAGAQIGMREAQSKEHLLLRRLEPFIKLHTMH